jgi:hypothetical protein
MPSSIVLEPLCLRYGHDQEQGLEELERQLAMQSTLPPVALRRPEDVQLSLDGLVQQRYQFTHKGLSSLCTRLVQGLSGPISRIAGLLGDLHARPQLAVRILNAIIVQCFDERLADCRLIVDPTRNAIEGVVSSRYEFLSNGDWLSSCQSFVRSQAGSNAEFLAATLAGRRLLVQYIDRRRWITVRTSDGASDSYLRGWSFSNSETGDAAVRVGMLIADESRYASLRPLGRCMHTKSLRESKGRDMLRNLRDSYERINSKLIRSNLRELHSRMLPQIESLTELQRVSANLVAQLSRRISKNIARSAISAALSPQVYSSVMPVSPVSSMAFSTIEHSHYHLYCSLTTIARGLFPREQENAERLAYELLRGKVSLPDGEHNG